MLRPFPSAPLKQLPQFGGDHAEALLWGTYRPGYYFGELCILPCMLFGPALHIAAFHPGSLQAAMPAPSPGTGMRMRQPRSLLVGVMWMDPQRQDPLGNIRWGGWGGTRGR